MIGKKGDVPWLLIMFLIAIAVGGILLMISIRGGKIISNSTVEQLACGGIGITKGTCIVSDSECTGVPIKGLGCPSSKPWCCQTERGSGPALNDAFSNCKEGTWTNKDQCRVKLTAARPEGISSGGRKTFTIVCETNRLGVPCYLTPEIKLKGGSSASVFLDDSKGTGGKEFTANLGKFYYWANAPGDYVATCSLDTSKCFVNEPATEAKAAVEFRLSD